MRFVVSVGVLLAACCLFSPQRANATTPNTYTYSTIDFDDSTGIVLATGHTQADYQTGAYYQTTGAGLSLKDANGNQLASQQKQVSGLSADASAQTYGYADQTYEVDTGHYILATYYLTNYYYQGQYQNGYDDQYNYTAVEGQNWGYFDAYTFDGAGPLVVSQYTNDFILGQTRKTVKVGTPNHVWVVSDSTTYPDCGRPVRVITYKIVDVNNRATGITSFEEAAANIYDSCTSLTKSVGGTCETTLASAQFQDTINVGCPIHHPCGFTYPNQYSWCQPSGGTAVIATVTAQVSDTAVLVDGYERFDPSTTIYP